MTTPPPRHPERGMTLVEVLVTLGIAGVLMTGVFGAVLAQTRIQREQSAVREASRAARDAVAAISDLVGRAGYGLEPAFAFDFSWYDCSDANYSGDAASCAPAARDNPTYDGGNRVADQLVFMSRNPRYFARADNLLDGTSTLGAAWEVVDGSAASVRVWAHEGDVFRRGQVLFLACPGAFSVAYATVGTTTQVSGTNPKATQMVTVPLMTAVANDPYKQNDALSAGCFDTGLARAFAIDRYRLFVSMDRSDPIRPRPFLFLDRGMDLNLDGAIDDADLLPVAPDVEDLQVAYITRGGNVFGTGTPPHQLATAGTDFTLNPACTTQVASWYGARSLVACRTSQPQRTADRPGNVTAVRVTVVTRTPAQRMQDQGARTSGRPMSDFSAENHDRSAEALDGYERVRLSTTIEVPNLGTRGVPLL